MTGRRHRLLGALLLTLPAVAGPGRPLPRGAAESDAVANDHRTIAGVLRDGEYTLALELRTAIWRPNRPAGLAVPIAAFAVAGGEASIPGPLIRVPAGTSLTLTIRNTLAEPAVVHGLHDHDAGRDSLVLGAGESREVRFVARRAGTFAYFARTTAGATIFGRRGDSQLMGAFVVDPAGTDSRAANDRERVMVITAWDDSVRNVASPYGPGQVYAINGRSWPFTERLRYDQGDSVHWRVLNLSQHAHPMHLHGTFFSVGSRGTPFVDSSFAPGSRVAVTEYLGPGATMTLAWKAERPGNWLFHCHTINHIDEALRLGDAKVTGPADHATPDDAMAGLVMALTVRPTGTIRPSAAPARRLRLFVTERPSPAGGAPSLAYVLQRGRREPAPDSLELPGSTLELRQHEPTAITVVNRSRHATAVHWHGMEIESYFDGVAGWSGAGHRVAPIVAPGDSFVARLTPPRAGTFIYHTHAGELAQIMGGLYGALLVRPRNAAIPPSERLIILGDSTADSLVGRTPPPMINGRSDPAPIELTAGVTHRLRLISIGAVTRKQLRLLDGDSLQRWTPVAKDGADYPPERRVERAADQVLGAGETMDVLVTPRRAGTWILEVASAYGPSITTRVPVRVRAGPSSPPQGVP